MEDDVITESVIEEVSMMPVEQIKPYSKNAEVYGDAKKDGSIAGLARSISGDKIREPLVVTAEGTLVSGHRRLRAAQSLGLTKVPVRLFPSVDETEIKSALLAFNVHRIKTKRQLIGEGQLRLEIKRAQKRAQKAAKAKGGIMENFPTGEKGATRDLAAQELGISGRTLEKGIKAEGAIKKLRAEGKEKDADLVEAALEKSIDAGLTVAKSLGAVEESPRKKAAVADETISREEAPTTVESGSELAEDAEPPNTKVRPFPKPVQDSDAAIEEADRLVSFLRSAEAKVLNTVQRRDLEKVLMQIVRLGEELGFVTISERRAA